MRPLQEQWVEGVISHHRTDTLQVFGYKIHIGGC